MYILSLRIRDSYNMYIVQKIPIQGKSDHSSPWANEEPYLKACIALIQRIPQLSQKPGKKLCLIFTGLKHQYIIASNILLSFHTLYWKLVIILSNWSLHRQRCDYKTFKTVVSPETEFSM